jgi:hypothetical protein
MATINTGLGGPQGVGEGSFRAGPLTAGNYDDGSIAVNITSVFGAQGINFFGTNYTSIFINTNGLITFNGPVTAYTPSNLANIGYPAISPFWSDVNITSGSATGTNNIYWDLDPGSGRVTITWLGVRAYQNPNGQGTNTFQVVLQHTQNGNFEVEFIYQQIQWTNGFTGVAQVGITDGGTNDYIVPGSGSSTAILQYPNNDFDTDDPNGVYSIRFLNGNPVCLAAGTRVATPSGPRRIETLGPGDLVLTLSGSAEPVLWAAAVPMRPAGAAEPVRIAAGALDNSRDLIVSRCHLMRVDWPECALLFGDEAVLAAAKDLVGAPGIAPLTGRRTITYCHLLLPAHHVILAEGTGAESLHPGPVAMASLPAALRRALAAAVAPATLRRIASAPLAARVLRRHEAAVLVAMRNRDRDRAAGRRAA